MRRARRQSQPQCRMVIKPQTRLPQKRRTVRISEKWTKSTRTRLSPPSKHMDCNGATSRLHKDYSIFKFGTAAKIEQRQIKHPQEEDVTVCSSDTHSMFHKLNKHKRCKPTAMMQHRMWIKGNSPHNENKRPPSLQTERKKERSYPTKQVTYRPTDKTIRSVLSINRTKKKGIAKQGLKQKVSQVESITPIQIRNARNSMNDTAISSYQPMSSALRYALLRSNKRYKPGD